MQRSGGRVYQAEETAHAKALGWVVSSLEPGRDRSRDPAWPILRTAKPVWLEQSEPGSIQEVGQGDVGKIAQGPLGCGEDFGFSSEDNGEPWRDLGRGGA